MERGTRCSSQDSKDSKGLGNQMVELYREKPLGEEGQPNFWPREFRVEGRVCCDPNPNRGILGESGGQVCFNMLNRTLSNLFRIWDLTMPSHIKWGRQDLSPDIRFCVRVCWFP